MIASLVLYGLVTGGCVALAALAAERVAKLLRRSVRWVWAGALLTIVALMISIPLRRATDGAERGTAIDVTLPTSLSGEMLSSASRRIPPAAGNVLGWAWLVASGGLLLLLGGVHLRYRRLRAGWPLVELGGRLVRVAPSDGPAVMGFVRPEIVVPEWLLDRPSAERQMVVEHEAEHLRSGDPVLLTLAWLVAVAMPWNAAVWWMLSRLRLAVELDCDARVLGAGAPANDYANVLIDIASEHAGLRFAAPALLGSPTHLHRRLAAMYAETHRLRALRGAAAFAVALAAFVVACGTELPTSLDSLDVAAAERLARQSGTVGDSIVFTVDGVRVPAEKARMVPASRIARVETVRGRGKEPSTIAVWTTDARVDGRVVADREVEGTPTFVRRAPLSQNTPFQGLLLVDGKRADPSILATLNKMSIESVEVIRGVAARRMYPEPASEFGVIVITTKK